MATYTIGSDPGDDYETWTAFHAAVASPAAGSIISFRKGDTFREQVTVAASGSDGSPITYTAHGTGDDPIISGSDLVTGWTEYESWQVAWDPTLNSENSSSGERNYRQSMEASTSSYDGSKIRVTVTAGASNNWTFGGASIGVMTTDGTFDSTPTRITWDTENNGATINAGESKVSDEITFAFDKTNRHGFSFYMADRTGLTFHATVGGTLYYNSEIGDESQSLSLSSSDSASPRTYHVDKVEVYASNVWQAACTTEPEVVFFDGAVGTNQASVAACTSTGDWYWSSNVLYTYSTTDPDSAFTSPGVEAAKRLDCFHVDEKKILLSKTSQ